MLVMEFEVFKKSHLKRNILIAVLVAGVISAIVLNFTRAKYRVTQSIPLVNGTINYSLADLNVVAITIDGEESDTLPEGNYELLDTSYCTIDGENANLTINWDTETQALSITPFTTKGTKCYLYFDEALCPAGAEACDMILAGKKLATRTDFSTTLTTDTTGTIYYADTSKGRTYYFAGNPTDNWVFFGGFYWRIIRINGNGSIRIIYQGTAANTTGTATQTQISTFNSTYSDNMYVGYMYQSHQVHGLTSNSTIKGILDTWYQNNLADEADKIDGNAGFCGDRTSTTSSSGAPDDTGGTGTTATYYGARYRLDRNKIPTFECPDEDNDLYTTSGSEDGNGALTYPIGLISADEVAYAGGVVGTANQSYYLYTGQYYWTMSPYIYPYAYVFLVTYDGSFDGYGNVNGERGVRPVINLKANVQISTGSGTSSDPYVIA